MTLLSLYPSVPLSAVKACAKYALIGGPFGSKLGRSDYVDKGIPVIRGSNLPDGARFSFDDFVFVTEEKARDLASNLAFPGDVVVTQRGTLGQVGLIPATSSYDRFVLSQSQMKLTVDRKRADSLFVYYALRSPIGQHEIKSRAITAGVPHINLSLFQDLQIPLPPLPVQRRIASILSAYDDLIENNTRRIQILEEMAQAIYREWFVEFRFPGHEGLRMEDSELGPIPEGWCIRALGDVCRRVTDGAHKSPPSVPEGYAMASVKDMTPRSLNLASCRRIPPSDYDALVRQDCKPRKGDVLIAKDGSYLKQVFAVEEERDVVILSSIALLRPDESIDPWVLALYLRQPETRERLAGYVSGVAIPRIVLKDFKAFRVVLPPSNLQEDFVDIIRPILVLALNFEQSNAALRQACDLLLPRLISGEIDVSNLDVGSAEPAA